MAASLAATTITIQQRPASALDINSSLRSMLKATSLSRRAARLRALGTFGRTSGANDQTGTFRPNVHIIRIDSSGKSQIRGHTSGNRDNLSLLTAPDAFAASQNKQCRIESETPCGRAGSASFCRNRPGITRATVITNPMAGSILAQTPCSLQGVDSSADDASKAHKAIRPAHPGG